VYPNKDLVLFDALISFRVVYFCLNLCSNILLLLILSKWLLKKDHLLKIQDLFETNEKIFSQNIVHHPQYGLRIT